MKKYLLLYFCFLGVTVLGQQYHPLVKEGGVWIIQSNWDSYPDLNAPPMTTKYLLTGDTIVNGESYKKLYYGWGDTNFIANQVVACLREDTSKKVFIIHVGGNHSDNFSCHGASNEKEHLLYDFNLQVGDTLTYSVGHDLNDTSILVVSNIDSVLISNSYRRRFEILYERIENNEDTWIEGLGSLQGLAGPHCTMHWRHWLSCYYDSAAYWRLDSSRSCSVVSIKDFKNDKSILVSPNPTDGPINITIPKQYSETVIEVYNPQGKIMDRFIRSDQSEINIDITSPNGIYFLIISTDEGVWVEKVMKK